jgi:hypothetical protein
VQEARLLDNLSSPLGFGMFMILPHFRLVTKYSVVMHEGFFYKSDWWGSFCNGTSQHIHICSNLKVAELSPQPEKVMKSPMEVRENQEVVYLITSEQAIKDVNSEMTKEGKEPFVSL